MKIQSNKPPIPSIESFTVILTPREAVLLAALIGNQSAEERMEAINSSAVDYNRGFLLSKLLSKDVPANLNTLCSQEESYSLEPLYYELIKF